MGPCNGGPSPPWFDPVGLASSLSLRNSWREAATEAAAADEDAAINRRRAAVRWCTRKRRASHKKRGGDWKWRQAAREAPPYKSLLLPCHPPWLIGSLYIDEFRCAPPPTSADIDNRSPPCCVLLCSLPSAPLPPRSSCGRRLSCRSRRRCLAAVPRLFHASVVHLLLVSPLHACSLHTGCAGACRSGRHPAFGGRARQVGAWRQRRARLRAARGRSAGWRGHWQGVECGSAHSPQCCCLATTRSLVCYKAVREAARRTTSSSLVG